MVIDTTRLLQAATRGLAAGEQEVEDPDGIDITRLLSAAASVSGKRGTAVTLEKDLGVGGAFAAGLKTGLIEPFRLLGADPEEADLDETSEQVANFLGAMVGLGISFIPFAVGTGIVLRGIGLTAKLAKTGATAIEVAEAARSQALFNFVRNTAAGSIQFAGTAEEFAEVPGKAVTGAAFGAAIEGIFLARAMRGRRGAVGKEHLVNDGNPVPDVPVDLDRMASEIEVSPSVNKTTERMTQELDGVFTQNKSYEEVITDLLGEHIETARFTGLSLEGSKKITSYARENFSSAQVLSRGTQVKGVHEVLLHQPFDPANVLTKRQIAEWKATGFASGEELSYAGRRVEATGGISPEPGTVSVRDPLSKGTSRGVPILVPIEEITRPTTTRFFNKSAGRNQTLQEAVRSMDDRIGFVVPASTVGRGAALSARRGFVDVSEFATASNFDEFAKPFLDDIASVQAANPKEAVGILAQRTGIPGLRIVDEEITTKVHIFDQKKVGFVTEPPRVARSLDDTRPIGQVRQGLRTSDPGAEAIRIEAERRVATGVNRRAQQLAFEGTERRGGVGRRVGDPRFDIARLEAGVGGGREVPNLGLVLDDVVMNQAGELQSFVPSWKNSISAPLREAGFPEKEIAQYLDLYAINTTRRLDSLMDPEFQAIKNASEIQFGGCP